MEDHGQSADVDFAIPWQFSRKSIFAARLWLYPPNVLRVHEWNSDVLRNNKRGMLLAN